ncbi:hypothetical protein OHA72_33885 [Dactylosporangium sp. NBC_01737]|uniref:hypothetical protein n=1 Tax=Dactylosporangium sp. NBC_01737 TaxID=2975959 RepID=UPI002E13A26E|nr:hypothetical protein OHA72_33885 [Dactylosporangium sp. NBC_01737]
MAQPSSDGGRYTRPTPNHSAASTTRAPAAASGAVTRNGVTAPAADGSRTTVGCVALMAAPSARPARS